MDMSTETPTRPTEVTSPGRRSPWLWILAVVAALAIGVVVGWLVLGGDSSESTVDAGVEQRITALIDDWFASWHNADGELALSLFSHDGRYVGLYTDGDGWSGDELIAGVERWGSSWTDPVRSGKPLIIERSNSYHVVQRWRQTFEENREYVDLFNIVDVDGAMKIRYAEGWQSLGWSQAAEGLPYRPVPEHPYRPVAENG